MKNQRKHSDLLNNLLARIDELLLSKDLSEDTLSVQSVVSSRANKVRLPKLHVEKFDGKPLHSQGFWDQFDSSINSNDSLSDIDKFTYLTLLGAGYFGLV